MPPLEERSFGLWIVITIFTGGIGLLFYYYLNLNDLEKLSYYPVPSNVPSTKVNSSVLLVLLICLPPIGFLISGYFKYEKLHNFIKEHPQMTHHSKVVDGIKFLLIWIIGGLLITLFSGGIEIAWDYYGYLDYKYYLIVRYVMISLILITVIVMVVLFCIIESRWQNAYNDRVRLQTMAIRY
ncbi:MAG: hypothetical protein ACFFDW_04800 [Candidatus Thorarchaeota archaeon]